VGTDNAQAEKVMKELYEPFIRTGNPLLLMDTRSAEVTKYAANAMLATRISFMNEMANFCERVGANIDEVRKGLGTDPRIGGKFLFAGVGYGGSCFPKDVQAIIKTGHQHHLEMTLIEAVEKVNHHQKTVLVEKIEKHFHHKLEGKTFAVWGLSFKPNTDDMREAPSLIVIQHLLKAGAIVRAYDPVAIDETRKILPKEILYCKNAYDALEGADALVLVTEWNEFRTPDFKKMLKLMKTGVIFDGRNVYDPLSIQEHGFDAYYSIGR
jgi:UDPglucose 6-dehydrogenase